MKFVIIISIVFVLLFPSPIFASSHPESTEETTSWIKTTSNWYWEKQISQSEFVNAMNFLIEKNIIQISSEYEKIEWNTEIGDEQKGNKNFSPFELGTGIVGVNKNIGFGSSEKVMTEDDLKKIKEEIKSLDKVLKEAIRTGDKEKGEEISGEIEKYESFISANTFNGKIKTTTQLEIEKARQNVRKAIKAAINNIKKKNKVLGAHLDNCIHTGKFCSYRP